MKTKKMVLTALIVLAIAIPITQAKPTPRGFWEYYTHSKTIPYGDYVYHEHRHEGALTGYADVTSSTGTYSMTDNWNSPSLQVWITNTDDSSISVTWRCYFYVN